MDLWDIVGLRDWRDWRILWDWRDWWILWDMVVVEGLVGVEGLVDWWLLRDW